MRKRPWKGMLAFAILGFCGFLSLLWMVPRHRINRESFERIMVGMTESEVAAALGVPAGDYCSTPEGTILTCFIPDGPGACVPLVYYIIHSHPI